MIGDRENVLIAPPRKVQHHEVLSRFGWGQSHGSCNCVRRLESRNDAFKLTAELECGQRLLVGGGDISRATGFLQPGMFRDSRDPPKSNDPR
jgi:hypothetical protein